MQQSPLAFHGNTNSVQQVDGIRFNNLEGAGQYSGMYWNDGMIQEIQYTTSGDSAETQAGGVRINMIPKEGGNSFRGTFFGNFTYDKWHSNNLDQRLIDSRSAERWQDPEDLGFQPVDRRSDPARPAVVPLPDAKLGRRTGRSPAASRRSTCRGQASTTATSTATCCA